MSNIWSRKRSCCTQTNLISNIVNLTEFELYNICIYTFPIYFASIEITGIFLTICSPLPLSFRKRKGCISFARTDPNFVWWQINQEKILITIKIWFNLTKFRKKFLWMCILSQISPPVKTRILKTVGWGRIRPQFLKRLRRLRGCHNGSASTAWDYLGRGHVTSLQFRLKRPQDAGSKRCHVSQTSCAQSPLNTFYTWCNMLLTGWPIIAHHS